MEYQGKIYRPWMEAQSLLLPVTYGCSHNTCTFCTMFSDKRFTIRPLDDIYQDIDKASQQHHHIPSIFLIDGNVLIVKTSMLLKIMHRIKERIPSCQRIAMYSTFNDLRNKNPHELQQLKQAGLNIVYAGLESGDTSILQRVKKNMSPEQALEGMAHAKEAGLAVHSSIIFGLGGNTHSQQHIRATAKLLQQLQPEEISSLNLSVQPGSQLEQEVKNGQFTQASPLQLLEEEKYLLEHINFPTLYWGDHGNNIVSKRGYLPEHQREYIALVDSAIDQIKEMGIKEYHPQPW